MECDFESIKKYVKDDTTLDKKKNERKCKGNYRLLMFLESIDSFQTETAKEKSICKSL